MLPSIRSPRAAGEGGKWTGRQLTSDIGMPAKVMILQSGPKHQGTQFSFKHNFQWNQSLLGLWYEHRARDPSPVKGLAT